MRKCDFSQKKHSNYCEGAGDQKMVRGETLKVGANEFKGVSWDCGDVGGDDVGDVDDDGGGDVGGDDLDGDVRGTLFLGQFSFF